MSHYVQPSSPAYNTSCPSILLIASTIPTRSTFLPPRLTFCPKSSALKFEHPPSFPPHAPPKSLQELHHQPPSPSPTLTTTDHYSRSPCTYTPSRPLIPSLSLSFTTTTPSPKPSILPYTLQPLRQSPRPHTLAGKCQLLPP